MNILVIYILAVTLIDLFLKCISKSFKNLFIWYDMWMGFYWDNKKKWLYFFPIPMIGIVYKF